MKTAHVVVPSQKVQDADGFKKLSAHIAEAIKNSAHKSLVTHEKHEKNRRKQHVSISDSYEHEELTRLRSEVKKYEDIIDSLVRLISRDCYWIDFFRRNI